MPTHLEQSVQRDIDRIRSKVNEMASLGEHALNNCMRALAEKNRVLAYSIILGDQRIDELEKEVDRLCLEFIVRQQPVAGLLRLAYATIRINLELERVGDYAESIARQILKLSSMDTKIPVERYTEIASLSIPMLRDSVRAFVEQDAELARETMATEEVVDGLKSRLNSDLMKFGQENRVSFESLNALMMIARHFERVSDQAQNICAEVLYMCTGEFTRNKGTEASRLLFVDGHNSCCSQMAEAIANSLHQPQFVFSSAGLAPKPIDAKTLEFLREKGLEVSRATSKSIDQVPNFEHYQIMISLAKETSKRLPPGPKRTVCLDWAVQDPSQVEGSPQEIHDAYESVYQFLQAHIKDLVEAVLDEKID